MSYVKYEQLLKDAGTPRTDAVGGEIALKKTDAIRALELLKNTDIGVLGGDVYELEDDGYFQPTYDNWYCSKNADDGKSFAQKSRKVAIDYIRNYKEISNINIRYVIVLDI
jgi:hypothetical protein